MIDISLLGTGGMMPLPNRALTSLYIRYMGKSLMIDCGEGTQTALRQTAFRMKPIEAILLTHLHADHVSGLPGLLLSMGNEGKTEKLMIYGPVGTERVVRSLLVIAPEIPFEIECQELSTEEPSNISLIGLSIIAFPLKHGIPCLGYSFNLSRPGKFIKELAEKNGVPVALWKILQHGESVDGFSPSDVLGEERRGIKFLYATDTLPVPAIAEYGKGADLLILEGMYGDAEKQARTLESHHMMMQEAANIAKEAGAEALWLTHYSVAVSDPSIYAEELQEIFPNTIISTDGMTQTLLFKD